MKTIRYLLIVLISVLYLPTDGFTNNFSHIKTFGVDYFHDWIASKTSEIQWLAAHQDMVVGLQSDSDHLLSENIYDIMYAVNPNFVHMPYIAYNTMTPWMVTIMENWCTSNGKDVEELYYHYYYDTDVLLRNQQTVTYLGYGGGTAASYADSRVPSTWIDGAYDNINPTSQTFRDAFKALVLYTVSINASTGKYSDGIFLDTFEGTIHNTFDLHLENTWEMIALEKTTSALAKAQAEQDLYDSRNEIESYISTALSKTMRLIPNAADADYIYNWYHTLYHDRFDSNFNEICVEGLIGTTSNISEITRMKQIYDDMDAGVIFLVQSNTNNVWGGAGGVQNIPFDFTQCILAVHYMINHDNAYFAYHEGDEHYADMDGDGTIQDSHWHINLEYNIGSPVTRSGNDYWGIPNTDRFFILEDGGSTYKVIAREYTKALVVAKIGNMGGYARIGSNQSVVDLGGIYKRLLADNSLGPAISQISLGFLNGVILIRNVPNAPTNFQMNKD